MGEMVETATQETPYKKYYEAAMSLEEAENYISASLVTVARAYVANGYYLKRIRDDRLYEEAGYKNFEDYVRGKYGKDKGWASKCIRVNQQLSAGGDSPLLDNIYKDYSTYQLVELAYMTEEQRELASPEQTVKQMQELRRSEKVVTSQQLEEMQLPGQMNIMDFPGFLPTIENGEELEIGPESPEIFQMELSNMWSEEAVEDFESVPAAAFEEISVEAVIEASEEESQELAYEGEETVEEISDLELLRDLLRWKQRLLNDCLNIQGLEANDIHLRKQKLEVGAIASMLCDLEEMGETPEQPELPCMKNNEQRKEWLKSFHEWPVWFEVPEASETYYRYDLPDGSSLVICEYRQWLEWRERYGYEGSPDAVFTREYLLTPGYHYLHDCQSNQTAMIEKLKEIQKLDHLKEAGDGKSI